MGRLGIRAKQRIALQERDYEILRFLAEQKFATREQIARRFFPRQSAAEGIRPDQVAYRRILILSYFGMIEKRHVRTEATQLYQVGKEGLAHLINRGQDVMPYLPQIDLRTYEHDRRVTDVRIALEWIGAKDWWSERRLFHADWKGAHRPDALFTLGKNRCSLEIEIARKREDRYPPIFRSIREQCSFINGVFYICGNGTVRKTVLNQAKKLQDAGRYYFATWEDWLAKEVLTEFVSATGERVTLESLV